jgi:GH15 family glucan-1,4-alpha-glucosidase
LALLRPSVYDKTKSYLDKAITIFEGVISFSNHLGMFSEEIAMSGRQLGNAPQVVAMVVARCNIHVGVGVS